MALSSKLKADYVELINQKLDHMPILSIEEFDLVSAALSYIVTPLTGYTIPEALQERIFDISELIYSPESYVESESDFAEYKTIIRDRIVAKKDELLSFSDEQKLTYIQTYQERGAAAAQYQEQIVGRQAPALGSDAHTIPEEEWLMQAQRQFQQELSGQNALITALEGSLIVTPRFLSMFFQPQPRLDRADVLSAYNFISRIE